MFANLPPLSASHVQTFGGMYSAIPVSLFIAMFSVHHLIDTGGDARAIGADDAFADHRSGSGAGNLDLFSTI
jgi:hypothetical protein